MKEVNQIKFIDDTIPFIFLLDDSLSLPNETFFIHNKNKGVLFDRQFRLSELPDNITEIIIYNNNLNSSTFNILNDDEIIFDGNSSIISNKRTFYEVGILSKINGQWYFKETGLNVDKNIHDAITKYYKGIYILK